MKHGGNKNVENESENEIMRSYTYNNIIGSKLLRNKFNKKWKLYSLETTQHCWNQLDKPQISGSPLTPSDEQEDDVLSEWTAPPPPPHPDLHGQHHSCKVGPLLSIINRLVLKFMQKFKGLRKSKTERTVGRLALPGCDASHRPILITYMRGSHMPAGVRSMEQDWRSVISPCVHG